MGDMLSQAEIDALLNGSGPSTEAANQGSNPTGDSNELTLEEIDALGEIGNISMGTSATTLSTILNEKVSITTPKVTVLTWDELIGESQKPYVVVKVEFTEGLKGTNLLILNPEDVKVITKIMMGGDESVAAGEIGELHLSAISEAMNQMIGSAATSIAAMTGNQIDISPPVAENVDFASNQGETYSKIYGDEKITKIAFRMVIGNVVDSEIMQLLPVSFAKELVKNLVSGMEQSAKAVETSNPVSFANDNQGSSTEFVASTAESYTENNYNNQTMAQPMVGGVPKKNMETSPKKNINVQPAQFQALEEPNYVSFEKENVNLIMDVPLQVTVELGRTNRLIREVLEFGAGSIVELDKLAGEPVDILVNGKIIAKGEVVVIDENFGVRITEIVHPSKRF